MTLRKSIDNNYVGCSRNKKSDLTSGGLRMEIAENGVETPSMANVLHSFPREIMQIVISIALVVVSISVAHLLLSSSKRQDANSPRVKWTIAGLFIAFCVLLGISDQFDSRLLNILILVVIPAICTVLWHVVSAKKPRSS
ncbi:hypothetical protein [Paeniglutamicibacter terrestris]|uniref:Uncharacterized protein n=1 Tax=Paeniglutamicibacter terrestris TaxID=2723403 RepID=A0ABX1G8G6_9MICC|nr:hypothetical protein [Paeniglutamicibacter terrestris]NKG21830.1 hypothetical protein [Paeniglutamicibacter terrestris]